MNDKNIAAIYCRLSEEDKDKIDETDDSRSIQNQKSMLLSYAFEQGWEVCDIYCDDDYSGAYAGSDNDRPAFNQMLEDAKNGKFNIILCKSQSRFSRNMEEIERYLHKEFDDWGIRFVSIVDHADTANQYNKKLRQVNGLMNEWYLEELSDNIRGVFKNKMKNGEYLASFPPYGYKKDPEAENHLVIDPQTSPVVKQIFQWHLDGFGAARISRMLNDSGIPNPRKQQELNGLRKQLMYEPCDMGKWSTTTIGDILHNQTYCGDVVQHKRKKVSYKSKKIKKIDESDWIIVENMHEAIIDRKTFDTVQKNLADRRKSTGTGRPHILAGKVFCHYCGKPMQKTHSSSNKTEHIEYLRCRDKYSYSDNDRCKTPNIRVDTILSAIQMNLIENFKDAFINSLEPQNADMIICDFSDNISLIVKQIEKLQSESRRLDTTIQNLYIDKVAGVITAEQFTQFNTDFLKKKERYEQQIQTLTIKIAKLQQENQKAHNIQSNLKRFFENKNIDREVIDELIDRIEFGEINPETHCPILKITWAWE